MRGVVDRVRKMERSGIRTIMDLAGRMAGSDIIHLEVGEPHFPTPRFILEGAHQAAVDGFTRYTPNSGLPEVRWAVAQRVRKDYPDLAVSDRNVVLTHGGVHGVALSILALIQPGHKVLIPDPGWPNYALQAITANAEPLYYPLRPSEGFEPSVEDLERIVTEDTDAIIVNSPSNPTGAVFREETLHELLEFARRYDLYVISDEVYDKVVYEGVHIPMARLDFEGRVVMVNSFSKTYSMTGWRLGYVIASEELCNEFVKLSEALISCPSAISQKAGEVAATGPQELVGERLEYYRGNRDILAESLVRAGLPHVFPHAGFYVLVDVSASRMKSDMFASQLLQSERVAVAPGTAFGPSGYNYIRVSFCTDRDTLRNGAERIVQFISTNT